ncbi:hypothetical protein BGW39_006214 [Mortierella sp. 14UC]|nr:hypothetical protein BGW39_006214 [Mortierella sp. 14UC]
MSHPTTQQQQLLALPPPPQHPFLIPELRDQITETLAVQDFSRCLLVNRLWNNVFTPYLYHTIVLRQQATLERTPKACSTRIATSFPHYGHWIRHLDLRMNDPDMDETLEIVRRACPWMETVKLSFGRMLEEQFESFILGVQSAALLSRFAGVRDPVQATRTMSTLKRWSTAGPTASGSMLAAQKQQQERRRRSVATELSTGAAVASTAAALLEEKEKQMLSATKARRNSISVIPTLAPLSCASAYESPVIVPTVIAAPPAITVTDTEDTGTDDTATTTTTAALDASHWRIPPGCNGFLSNTIKNLHLYIPGETLYAVLLWLTRAGLDTRLQGLKSFRLSGQETSSAVFGVSSSAIHDFLAAHPGLEQLTLLSIQVEPAPSETPWDCLEGSEGSEMLQLMIDSGSSPTPTTSNSADTTMDTRGGGGVTKCSGNGRDVGPEVDEGAEAMAAVTAALAAAVAGSSAQPAVYKGIHYKTHNADYFADLIALSQPTLERLKSSDPQASRSKVTDLHIFQDGQLGPLLSRLPHLLRLTTEFFERSRISPDLLQPIYTSCRSLVSFTYLGKPSCPFTDRFPRNNQPSQEPFFRHWETFIQELVHLKELILLNANLRDEDLRTLVGYGHDRLRILKTKGETRATWHGARMVLENCKRLEECILTCYGPVDDLFGNFGHPVELFYPAPASTAVSDADNEVEPIEDDDQQQNDQLQGFAYQEPPEWASKDTLHSLCLSGMVLYNDDVNHKLFLRLRKLRCLRGLTIAGRGMTLEALLGENLRVLALEDERLGQEEQQQQQQQQQQSTTTGTTTTSNNNNRRRSSLYPDLETLDLPRLTQKLSSKDLIQLMKELPSLRWMDCGGAYELETLMWLDARRRDLLKTFSR